MMRAVEITNKSNLIISSKHTHNKNHKVFVEKVLVKQKSNTYNLLN